MKKIYNILCISLISALVVNCQRRPLEDEIGDLAFVPIHIDWSQSGLDASKMHSASVWFYPQDGQQPIKHIAEESVTYTEVPLTEGVYSVVVFNEEVDFNWQSLQFEGAGDYSTFRVMARPGSNKGQEVKVEDTGLHLSPDAIASWSMDRFVVSAEMVRATAMGSRAELTDRSGRINATPLPLTKEVKIKAYVQNIVSARNCYGTLSGVVGGVLLSTREAYMHDVSHDFKMNDLKPDPQNPNNGDIHANLLIFGASPSTQHTFNLDFTLRDNTTLQPDPFNVTDRVVGDKPQIEISVGLGIEEEEKDHPIILPEVHIDEDVNVGGWEDGETTTII